MPRISEINRVIAAVAALSFSALGFSNSTANSAEACNEVLQIGLVKKFDKDTYYSSEYEFYSKYWEEIKGDGRSESGVGAIIPIEGVPVKFGFDAAVDRYYQSELQKEFSLQARQYYHSSTRTTAADANVLAAWIECLKQKDVGLRVYLVRDGTEAQGTYKLGYFFADVPGQTGKILSVDFTNADFRGNPVRFKTGEVVLRRQKVFDTIKVNNTSLPASINVRTVNLEDHIIRIPPYKPEIIPKPPTHIKLRWKLETVGLAPGDSVYCEQSRYFRMAVGDRELDLIRFMSTGRRHWFKLHLSGNSLFGAEIKIEKYSESTRYNNQDTPPTRVIEELANPGQGGGKFRLTVSFEGYARGGQNTNHQGENCSRFDF